MTFNDTPVPTAVKQWNVQVLQISKTRPHVTEVASQTFWKFITSSMLRRHPEYLPTSKA
jgi:hypothetical protein|tara:strand:- start:195 stop:371 length:177 start_codon:yes stop_codon:yes gene_type:complete